MYSTSTIIVCGGLGDWLSVADTVIGMEYFNVRDITGDAKDIAANYPTIVPKNSKHGALPLRDLFLPASLITGRDPVARDTHFVSLRNGSSSRYAADRETGLEVSALKQLIEVGHSRTIINSLQAIARLPGQLTPAQMVEHVEELIKKRGLDGIIAGHPHGDLVGLRRFEVGAALSRLRGMFVAQHD